MRPDSRNKQRRFFPAVCPPLPPCIMKKASFGSQKRPLGKSFTRVRLFAPEGRKEREEELGRGGEDRGGEGEGRNKRWRGRAGRGRPPPLAFQSGLSVAVVRSRRHCFANGNSFVVLTFIRNIKKVRGVLAQLRPEADRPRIIL